MKQIQLFDRVMFTDQDEPELATITGIDREWGNLEITLATGRVVNYPIFFDTDPDVIEKNNGTAPLIEPVYEDFAFCILPIS